MLLFETDDFAHQNATTRQFTHNLLILKDAISLSIF